MREHQFDAEEAALRPKASRIEDPSPTRWGVPQLRGVPTSWAKAG